MALVADSETVELMDQVVTMSNPQAGNSDNAHPSENFVVACVASFDLACPSSLRKSVSFGTQRLAWLLHPSLTLSSDRSFVSGI